MGAKLQGCTQSQHWAPWLNSSRLQGGRRHMLRVRIAASLGTCHLLEAFKQEVAHAAGHIRRQGRVRVLRVDCTKHSLAQVTCWLKRWADRHIDRS